MQKTVIILSVFTLMACKNAKQNNYTNEQFENDWILDCDREQIDSLIMQKNAKF